MYAVVKHLYASLAPGWVTTGVLGVESLSHLKHVFRNPTPLTTKN